MSCKPVVQSNPGNLTGLQLELFKKNSYGLQPGCKKQPGLLNMNLATLKQPNPVATPNPNRNPRPNILKYSEYSE